MIRIIEDSKTWSDKYGVDVKEGNCPKCGKYIIADAPFADKDLRGFISEDHGCGIEHCLLVFKSVDPNDKEYWLELAHGE
jgi:hypothetical protein